MNIIENMPRKFGMETTLFLYEIHTLLAIGRTEVINIRTITAILSVSVSGAIADRFGLTATLSVFPGLILVAALLFAVVGYPRKVVMET